MARVMNVSRPIHRSLVSSLTTVLLFAGCGDRAREPAGGEDPGLDRDATLDSTFPGPGPSESCTISIGSADQAWEQEEPFTCEIGLDTGLGCDELARCLCEHARSIHPDDERFDQEACVNWLVFPRGAITLADFCPYAGTPGVVISVGELVNEHSLLVDIDALIASMYQIDASTACYEVAAYTLWGEEPSWFLSLLDRNAVIPEASYRLEDYPFESEPLLTLDHVAHFTASEALAVLTSEGRDRLAERFDEGEPHEMVGRSFLVHTAEAPLSVGTIVSWVMSSTRPGPVLVAEELADADFGELGFLDAYPSTSPMVFGVFFLSQFAAVGKLLDASCISTCGCPGERGCRENICTELTDGCRYDEDCCLGRCGADSRCH